MVAWTTTPWTLPSNLALCVNPEMDYVKVKVSSLIIYSHVLSVSYVPVSHIKWYGKYMKEPF
jgi:isoleucyl-tRNA synthetase